MAKVVTAQTGAEKVNDIFDIFRFKTTQLHTLEVKCRINRATSVNSKEICYFFLTANSSFRLNLYLCLDQHRTQEEVLILSIDKMNSTENWKQLVDTFYRVSIASGIFLTVVSILTTFGNGLLLLAIWRDPFKTFRTPITFFVIGLAAADFLTGFAVCPIYALQFIAFYSAMKSGDSTLLQGTVKATQIAHHISGATMNSSYIILLLFTWSQFTAISFPHKHRLFITRKRVMGSVILTWLYSTAFALLPLMQVPETTFWKIDLYFHTTGSLLLLAVAYFSLYKAFRRQVRRLHSLKSNNTLARQQRRRGNRRERQFTVVNLLLLTFVISCTVPTAVVSYLFLHWDNKNPFRNLKLQIANLLATDVLFLKFALDPLIYAWRLAQYRRALKSILVCNRRRTDVDELFSYTVNNQTLVSFRRRKLNREVTILGNSKLDFTV